MGAALRSNQARYYIAVTLTRDIRGSKIGCRGDAGRRENCDADEEREQRGCARPSHGVYASFTATIENMLLALVTPETA